MQLNISVHFKNILIVLLACSISTGFAHCMKYTSKLNSYAKIHNLDSKEQITKNIAAHAIATVAVMREFDNAWCISKELFDYIRSVLPVGSTILELGSGWGSGELSKYYTVYSIENDKAWLNKYTTNYIYAPIKNGWYDVNAVKKGLPKKYDLILIDGPLAVIGRSKFFDNINVFNTDVTMIFDDVNRVPELELMKRVAQHVNRSPVIFSGNGKQFGVVPGK